MDERQHRLIARWERRWLAASAVISVMFVILIAYNLAVEGTHIAQQSARAQPETLLANELFATPGVRQLAPRRFQATIVGQTYSFNPSLITIPAGSEVEFYFTSRDVLHGYQVENTNINVELIPGEVGTMRYTFDEVGDYRVTCNEYCGIGHHTMLGEIRVLPAAQYALFQEERADAEAQVPALPLADVGAEVYAASCASCHQPDGTGLAGVFPPLAEHVDELYAEQGREYVVDVLLYGLSGPIMVGGTSYDGQMPAWAQLTNEQIAGTLNYIMSAWSAEDALPDGFEPYAPEDVAEARGADLSPADVYEQRVEGDQ